MYRGSYRLTGVKAYRLVGYVFLVVGLIFLIVSSLIHYFNNRFISNAESVIAQISRIETYRDSGIDEDSINHDVYVSYSIEGFEYVSKLDYYSSSMYEGKDITVYYYKENPEIVRCKLDYIFYIVFYSMSGIFIVLGVSLVIKSYRMGTVQLNEY